MSYLSTIMAFVLLIFMTLIDTADVSARKAHSPVLKIRTGNHPEYLRIVLEGPDSVISKGKLTRNGSNINVNFSGASFLLEKKTIGVDYRQKDSTLTFSVKNHGNVKSFTLKNPDRFIVDIYKKDKKEKTAKQKKAVKKTAKATKKTKKVSSRSGNKKALASNKASSAPAKKYAFNEENIPKRYKKYWELIKNGNGFSVLRILPAEKPENAEQLGVYHYIYGEAYAAIGDHHKAIEHLRLAYIYSKDNELKEQALIRRAGIYNEHELFYEAKSNYKIFIREFRHSGRIKEAYLGLAKSLAEIGEFRKAVKYFSKAGRDGETLFSKANALQKLGKIKKARETYTEAMNTDSSYVKNSAETYYLIGENMRMSGNLKEARKHFINTPVGLYKYYAYLSLGLIDMEESKPKEAITNFELANLALDRKLKVLSLFNLSLAYSHSGNIKKAIEPLEEIRARHTNSSLYKTTLLELSRLYRAEDRLSDSVTLLRELVYGQNPPREAFAELEKILIDAGAKTDKETADEAGFIKLWEDLGKWLLDGTREEFLVKMADRLKSEDEHFLFLSSWLAEHGSNNIRSKAALDLAEYYVRLGDTAAAQEYVNIVKILKGGSEGTTRIQAMIDYESGDMESAVKRMKPLKKFNKEDIKLLGSILTELYINKSKDLKLAMDFYEKKLNSGNWNAEAYVVMADVLHARGKRDKALKYYRTAYKIKPDDEWTVYRLGSGIAGSEAVNMLERIEKGDSIVGRAAKTKLLGMNLISKMEEVF